MSNVVAEADNYVKAFTAAQQVQTALAKADADIQQAQAVRDRYIQAAALADQRLQLALQALQAAIASR